MSCLLIVDIFLLNDSCEHSYLIDGSRNQLGEMFFNIYGFFQAISFKRTEVRIPVVKIVPKTLHVHVFVRVIFT